MKKSENYMSIGMLSKQLGIGIETIRYYERIGILSPVRRKVSGYRVFDSNSVMTLAFIKNAQELGFSLAEIKELLNLRANKISQCEMVRVKAEKHLQDIEDKIKKLEDIKVALLALIRQCRLKKTSKCCPILQVLEKEVKKNGKQN